MLDHNGNKPRAIMHIGDSVKLLDEAAFGQRREFAGEVGKVGDVWEDGGGTHCTVVYDAWQCLIRKAPGSDFEPARAVR